MAITFSKNGRYIISASQDKTLRLWNPHSGAAVKTYQGAHNQEVNDVKIFQDNARFASCGGDKQFFIWDVTTGQVNRKFVGHDRKVNSLAMGPNEDVLISASHDKTVRFWDLRARGKAIQTLTEASDSVLCVSVHGDQVISGSVDGAVRQYDVRRGQLTVDELRQPVGSLAVSNDGQCLLCSTLDSKIRLLERETGNELASYEGHVNRRFKVQSTLDPSDGFVVGGSEDNRLCFWELVEGTMVGSLEHSGPVFCVEFSGDIMATASADGVIKAWNVAQV